MPIFFTIGVLFAKIAAKFGIAASANAIAATVAGTLKVVAVSTAVSAGLELLNRLFRRGGVERQSPSRTVRTEIDNARWVIGRQRTAGTLIYYDERRDGAEAHMGLYLAEDECERIDGLMWIDGERVKLVRTSRAGGDKLEPEQGSEHRGKIEIYEYFAADGTQGVDMRVGDYDALEFSDDYPDATDPGSVWYGDPDLDTHSQRASGGDPEPFHGAPWTSAHKMEGRSWVYVKLTQPDYGDDTSQRHWSREPNLEFLVKGLKLTWPGQAAPAWTRNAAAIWHWWLTERRGWDASVIDRASFDNAFAFSEEDVDAGPLPPEYAHWNPVSKRYAIDYAVSSGASVQTVEDDLNAAWGGGSVVESGGMLYMRPGVDRRPGIPSEIVRITNDDILEPPVIEPWRALQDRVNAVQIELLQSSHAEDDWQRSDPIYLQDEEAIRRDGEVRAETVRLAAVSDPIAAGRLGTILLRQARESLGAAITVRPREDLSLMGLIPTDVVQVTHDGAGMDEFWMHIEGITIRTDWTLQLALREDHPDTYVPTLHLPPLDPRRIRIPSSTEMIPPVQGLALTEHSALAEDGTVVTVIVATWTTAATYETQIEIRTGGANLGSWADELSRSSTHRFSGVIPGMTYDVRARHRSLLGRNGSWSDIVSLAVAGDTGAPDVTILDAVRPLQAGLAVEWTNPAASDYAQSEAQVRLQDNTPVRTLFVNGTTVDVFDLDPAVEYKVRVRAIDASGNAGIWSSEISATPLVDSVAASGAAIFTGNDSPVDSPPAGANNGDLYIQGNGSIWKRIAGAWVDQMIDLTGPDDARVYALGDVASDATPAVPAGAPDGSIGFADDGRFWELVNGSWVFRGDLTGPPGGIGRPGARGLPGDRTFPIYTRSQEEPDPPAVSQFTFPEGSNAVPPAPWNLSDPGGAARLWVVIVTDKGVQ